jgi:type III pantothenate kinase
MLLAIDVGNTNVVFALFENDQLIAKHRAEAQKWRQALEWAEIIRQMLRQHDLTEEHLSAVAIASVVPSLTAPFKEMAEAHFNVPATVINSSHFSSLPNFYENPDRLGIDRLLNVFAVKHYYGYPAIVLDFGTATKFEVLSPKGEYWGGAIAPGYAISAEALFGATALLKAVKFGRPTNVIGRNSVESLQSGISYGYQGLVEEMLNRLQSEIGQKPVIVATGGLVELIAPYIRQVDVIDPDLTLKGINLIWLELILIRAIE